MKRILIILCTPLLIFGQDTTYNHQLEWNSNFLFESSSLDKSFLNTMLYGGYITDEIKSNWINAGGENNILYSEISNGLSYTYNFKKQSIGFSFADRNILNASFTDDLLRIGFEGNFHYQDKTLDFSNTSIRADRYQQYKIIFGTAINRFKINGGISYLAGNHHLSYIMEKGSLYTAPLGTYLDIEYDMTAFITDTSNFSVFANNGNGIAVEFSTEFTIKDYDVHLSITDLGFIIWNTSSITLATDSSFNYQGVEVEDIFNFNDSVLEANNIKDDVLKTNNASFKSYIPATVHLSVSGKTENKYFKTYTAGVIAKWQPYSDNTPLSFSKINQGFKESNFAPLFYLKSAFNNKYCDIIPTFSYGGYSVDTNVGLALSKGKKNRFVLGTQHLEDVLNGDKAKAVSLYFNLTIQF